MENKVMTEEGKPLRGFICLGDMGRLMAQDLLAAGDLNIAYSRPGGLSKRWGWLLMRSRSLLL